MKYKLLRPTGPDKTRTLEKRMHPARIGVVSFVLLGLLLLTVVFGVSRASAALALPEGRTNDKAHDTGYIDWSGPVQYVDLYHKDGSWLPPDEGGGYCGSGCWEWVTRMSSGGQVSGNFSSDPGTFNANIAFTHDSNAGSATLKACTASYTWNLYIGSGNGLPGFESANLTVPAGCRTWSLTASGGYVDFQAVEVQYAAPPLTSTSTATAIPSVTPSPTGTSTPSSTSTFTVTPSNTPTATNSPTATSTDTPSPTPTPMPPQITGQIVCDQWGDADWCSGDESLQLVAGDPQGYAVSISGDLNGAPFACQDSCSVPLPEGLGTAHYEVTSASGRTVSGSSSWKRDATPPVLNLVVPPAAGLNGWYVSPVDINADASDGISGVSLLQGKVDDGSDWASLPLHLTDGFFPIEVRARDVAGNETDLTDMIRVDTVPPVTDFTSHADGSLVQGNVTLAGDLKDMLSGPASGQISLDGGTSWEAVSMDGTGAWSFAWDTTALPNRGYSPLIRGTDMAGNVGNAAKIGLLVDNQRPLVSLTDRWWIWQTGELKITPNYFPIATVRMTIRDGENRCPAVVVEFDPNNVPNSISWDRRFADGTRAPSGDYQVTVEACDDYGLCGRATGIIAIPLPSSRPTATTSLALAPTPTATATATITPQPTATSTEWPVVPTRVVVTPITTAKPALVKPARPLSWWPLLGLLGLFLAVSSASMVDPRPATLDRLREVIQQMSVRDDIDSSRGDDKFAN